MKSSFPQIPNLNDPAFNPSCPPSTARRNRSTFNRSALSVRNSHKVARLNKTLSDENPPTGFAWSRESRTEIEVLREEVKRYVTERLFNACLSSNSVSFRMSV